MIQKKLKHTKRKKTPCPVLTVLEEDTDEYPLYTYFTVTISISAVIVSITFEGSPIEKELDTGTSYFLMSENNF